MQPGTCSYLTWVLYVWAHKGEPRALDTCKVLERMALGWAPRQSSDEAGEPSLHQCLGGQAQWVSLLSISYLFTSKLRRNLPIWGKPPLEHSNQGPMSSTTDQEAHMSSLHWQSPPIFQRGIITGTTTGTNCATPLKKRKMLEGERAGGKNNKKTKPNPRTLLKLFSFLCLARRTLN